MPGRRASSPQGAHVEAQEADRAKQPPVRIPDRRPSALKPSRDPAHRPWRARAEATAEEHHHRGAGQNKHGNKDRYPGVTQVERAIRHAGEQQPTGSPVHGEAERGQQTQQRGASPQQLPGAYPVTTQQQTRGRSRRDVSPRQHRTGTHRDPRDPPAVRARQLGEEVPEQDHVAQTGSELQRDRPQRPRHVHAADLPEDLPRRGEPDDQPDRDRANDRHAEPAPAARRLPSIRRLVGAVRVHLRRDLPSFV